jgi:hypothetical protein
MLTETLGVEGSGEPAIGSGAWGLSWVAGVAVDAPAWDWTVAARAVMVAARSLAGFSCDWAVGALQARIARTKANAARDLWHLGMENLLLPAKVFGLYYGQLPCSNV